MSNTVAANKTGQDAKAGDTHAGNMAAGKDGGKLKMPSTNDMPKDEPRKDEAPGARMADDKTAASARDSGDLPAAAKSEGLERNQVFGSLVKGDDDIVGLVAYSIYKQNKHDWLVSFNKAEGREPNEKEAFSYIVGESTQRRLAIYRHLAQATLDGRGPQVSGSPSKEKFVQRSLSNAAASGAGSPGSNVLLYIVATVVVVAAIYLAARFGLPGVPR